MPVIRIFLLTYRRPQLLRRALTSLCAQTFSNWVCELHNDAPDDPFPGQLLSEIKDPRITLYHHERNWGAVASFNHVFAGGTEPYACLLEDDNWWDSDFLETAFTTIEAYPSASLVWANMRVWQEQPDGHWHDTGNTIWSGPVESPESIRVFHWPEAIQSFTALHSNGAMLFRPGMFAPAAVPASAPFAIIENIRERAATGELILITRPLAHFALTIQSSRSGNRIDWLQSQLLISSTYFAAVNMTGRNLTQVWAHLRATSPRNTNLIFLTALALRRPSLLKPATLNDWLLFLLNLVRHPLNNLRGLKFHRDQPQVSTWLQQHTPPSDLRSEPMVVGKELSPTSHAC